jgi:hypothetical protein
MPFKLSDLTDLTNVDLTVQYSPETWMQIVMSCSLQPHKISITEDSGLEVRARKIFRSKRYQHKPTVTKASSNKNVSPGISTVEID